MPSYTIKESLERAQSYAPGHWVRVLADEVRRLQSETRPDRRDAVMPEPQAAAPQSCDAPDGPAWVVRVNHRGASYWVPLRNWWRGLVRSEAATNTGPK